MPTFVNPIIPTFNGAPIFNSIDNLGGSFFQGALTAGAFNSIMQTYHFEGENGDRYLLHGQADRTWRYRGYISAPDLVAWQGIIATIQRFIPKANGDETKYYTLVDSTDTTYTNAQIRTVSYSDDSPHWAYDHVVGEVVVTGIIQGMQLDGD